MITASVMKELKMRLTKRPRCFTVNFVKFLRTPFSIEHLWSLPLKLTMFCSKFSLKQTIFLVKHLPYVPNLLQSLSWKLKSESKFIRYSFTMPQKIFLKTFIAFFRVLQKTKKVDLNNKNPQQSQHPFWPKLPFLPNYH